MEIDTEITMKESETEETEMTEMIVIGIVEIRRGVEVAGKSLIKKKSLILPKNWGYFYHHFCLLS